MGTFLVDIEIGDPQGERWKQLPGTVGTRAVFAWAPRSVLEELGVQPEKRVSLRHPDGRLIKRDVGQTWLRIGDKAGVGTVVFGETRDPVLIGSDTLQNMLLKADLAKETLVPTGDLIQS